MTSLAVFECQIAAEGSLAVVTGETRRAARGDKVFGRRGGTYLACLGSAGSEPVTVITGQLFSGAVVCVAERVTIRARIRPCWSKRLLIVTDAARRDLTAARRFA